MGSKPQGSRFQILRERDLEGCLNVAEATELQGIVAALDALEVDRLEPSVQHTREQRERVEQANEGLRRLIAREDLLAARVRLVLGEVRTEQKAINRERRRILSASSRG